MLLDIHCRVCGEVFRSWPSDTKKVSIGVCDACVVIHGHRAQSAEPRYCQLCGTEDSPQWRKWRKFHACNACGIKMWRHNDADYYTQPHLSGGGYSEKNPPPTAENYKWAEEMMKKLSTEEE